MGVMSFVSFLLEKEKLFLGVLLLILEDSPTVELDFVEMTSPDESSLLEKEAILLLAEVIRFSDLISGVSSSVSSEAV